MKLGEKTDCQTPFAVYRYIPYIIIWSEQMISLR